MMVPVALIVALAFKHFFANYPLQCSYTVKGLGQSGWFRPMLARCSVHGLATLAVVMVYWMRSGHAVDISLLALVVAFDMVSHLLIDRFKVDKEFLGRFSVSSHAELIQMAEDYKSKDHSVVMAAQAKSDSNKYFWWSDGMIHMMYAVCALYIACLVK